MSGGGPLVGAATHRAPVIPLHMSASRAAQIPTANAPIGNNARTLQSATVPPEVVLTIRRYPGYTDSTASSTRAIAVKCRASV